MSTENTTNCSSCQAQYSLNKIALNLVNCSHHLCKQCVMTEKVCPIDGKKIDFNKYTLNNFQTNTQIQETLNLNKNRRLSSGSFLSSDSRKSSSDKTIVKKTKNDQDERELDLCLLHSKPADIVCLEDGNIICSNCAIFGQYRGKNVSTVHDFVEKLSVVTESTLQVYREIKTKEEDLNAQVVDSYMKDTFSEHRLAQIKVIKANFAKVYELLRKAEKTAITNLDVSIKSKQQQLRKLINLRQIEQETKQWYGQVQKLGKMMEQIYQMKNFMNGIKYLNPNFQQSQIAKNGQYLKLQYTSNQKIIKDQIDNQVKNTSPSFTDLQQVISSYCSYQFQQKDNQNKNLLSVRQSLTPLTFKTQDRKINYPKQEDNLLEGQQSSRIVTSFVDQFQLHNLSVSKGIENNQPASKPQSVNTELLKSFYMENKSENRRETYHKPSLQRSFNRLSSSSKSKNKDINQTWRGQSKDKKVNKSSTCMVLSGMDNRKKRKIEINEKYKNILDDLKQDKQQVIDFGGAQMGDSTLKALCQFICTSSRLKTLKLVRNKLTDDCIPDLIQACASSKITSLNLGQNSLTEKTLESLEKSYLGDLKIITLSLNRINRRNVKNRLDQLIRKGLTVSI